MCVCVCVHTILQLICLIPVARNRSAQIPVLVFNLSMPKLSKRCPRSEYVLRKCATCHLDDDGSATIRFAKKDEQSTSIGCIIQKNIF